MEKKNRSGNSYTGSNHGKNGVDPVDQGVKKIDDFKNGTLDTSAKKTNTEKNALEREYKDLYRAGELNYDEYVDYMKAIGRKPLSKKKAGKRKPKN